jgi:hypothetical protein
MVVPDTGVQEKAGLVLVTIAPLAGEAIVGTEAAVGETTKLRASEKPLPIGVDAATFQ